MYLNLCFFFFKQKTAYEMRISDWSSDVCSSDLHAVVDFGHFLRKQLLHEFGMGAAEENLRTPVFAAHVQDHRADAVADADDFAGDLLIAADDALGAAEIHHDMAEFDRLDDAGDDFTHAVLEFLMLALALGGAEIGRAPVRTAVTKA